MVFLSRIQPAVCLPPRGMSCYMSCMVPVFVPVMDGDMYVHVRVHTHDGHVYTCTHGGVCGGCWLVLLHVVLLHVVLLG